MLVRHISVEHAAMPNFKVKCGVDGCPDEYKNMNSFRKHLRTCHADEYSGNDLQAEAVEQPRNENPPPESYFSGESDDNDDDAFNSVMCL